ncbi:unnamed protein product, partial [Urochloa humidicola]
HVLSTQYPRAPSVPIPGAVRRAGRRSPSPLRPPLPLLPRALARACRHPSLLPTSAAAPGARRLTGASTPSSCFCPAPAATPPSPLRPSAAVPRPFRSPPAPPGPFRRPPAPPPRRRILPCPATLRPRARMQVDRRIDPEPGRWPWTCRILSTGPHIPLLLYYLVTRCKLTSPLTQSHQWLVAC